MSDAVPHEILQTMQDGKHTTRVVICGLLVVFCFAVSARSVLAQVSVTARASTTVVCGDGVKNGGEQCDGADLSGASCTSRGFAGGTLSCNASCSFNTSQCTSASPSPVPSGGGGGGGSGGGGGGGGGYNAPSETAAVFSGRAYPKSTVTLLKDAQIGATTVAGEDANFQISISGLSGGNYIFSVYSEDSKGIRSSLLTFPVSVTSGATTYVSGIFIAPTITVDKSEVRRGDNIAIFGQSVPNGEITVAVNSEKEFFGKTAADQNGAYLYNFDTVQLDMGQHFTKSKAARDGAISSFSKAISFAVGAKTVFAQPAAKVLKGDLNNDGRVNLVDFSIAAYWYKRPLNDAMKIIEKEKLGGFGVVDLRDFSIMAYYWTG